MNARFRMGCMSLALLGLAACGTSTEESAASGALGGAAAGTLVAGPIGTVVGAAIGGASGTAVEKGQEEGVLPSKP